MRSDLVGVSVMNSLTYPAFVGCFVGIYLNPFPLLREGSRVVGVGRVNEVHFSGEPDLVSAGLFFVTPVRFVAGVFLKGDLGYGWVEWFRWFY